MNQELHTPPAADDRAAYYGSYISFKGWDGSARTHEDESYAIEMARAGLAPPAEILELGFGDGRFLDWARRQGFQVSGVELIEELVLRARARGHDVRLGPAETAFEPASNAQPRRFDAIVAFDVFEHMTAPELGELLRMARDHLLHPHGRVIARVPNGASPFGRYYQSGDVTHRLALCSSSMSQIAGTAGMRVLAVHNAARSLRSGKHHWLVNRVRYAARDVANWLIDKIYFGAGVPLDPMITLVLDIEP